MTAPNHALTGALVGLSVSNPLLAAPLAFASHFVLDAIPHYDAPGTEVERIGSKRLIYEQLLVGAALCFLLVLWLGLSRPRYWVSAAICAFLAASPDLFWIPRFVSVHRTGKDLELKNWFLRFHHWIQWKTSPALIWFELAWFVLAIIVLFPRLT